MSQLCWKCLHLLIKSIMFAPEGKSINHAFNVVIHLNII